MVDKITVNETFLAFLLILLLSLILFSQLGDFGLPSFDDAYYAQKAKELLRTGDLFTLYYNNTPRFDNTPFYIWLVALMFKLFGVNEYNARFFSCLSAIGSLVVIYLLARIIYKDKWSKFFSVLVLATTFYYTKYAMHAMFDVTLSFLYTLVMLFFILGILKNEKYFLLSGVFVGFSILTKSLLGTFPIIIMGAFLLLYDRKKILSKYFILSILISLFMALPWYLLEYIKYGDKFLSEHFGWLFLERGFGKSLPKQNLFSYFYYLKFLLIFYLPWIPFAIASIFVELKKKKREKEEMFLLLPIIWILTVLILMSIPGTRKSWYIMPVFPALALITGDYFNRYVLRNEKVRILSARIIILVFSIIMIIVVATPISLKSRKSMGIKKMATVIKNAIPEKKRVNCFNMEFWSTNNSFLFYTDRMLKDPFFELDSLISIMKEEDEFCYIQTKDYEYFFKDKKEEFPIIVGTKDYILFTNRKTYDKLQSYNFLDLLSP